MKHLVLAIALAAFSTSAFAEGSYQNEDELRLVRAVSVWVNDQVKDGCLPNPNALKIEAELILRRSGISVSEGPKPDNYRLVIDSKGFESRLDGRGSGACTVNLDLKLGRIAKVAEGHLAFVIAYDNGVMLPARA